MPVCDVLRCLGLALMLSACAGGANHLNTTYIDRYAKPDPTPAEFYECHGFGCAEVSRVSLSNDEWRRVAAVFKPPAANAAAERRQIARGVAMMQMMVGRQTGTAAHQWTHRDMMILPNNSDPTQLDCIDEAVNTWTYLTLMEKSHLFRFHRVAPLSYAGSVVTLDQRNTAVLQQIAGGGYFAIDPSLVDAGVPPPIMPLATWMGHWPPDLAADERAPSTPSAKSRTGPRHQSNQVSNR